MPITPPPINIRTFFFWEIIYKLNLYNIFNTLDDTCRYSIPLMTRASFRSNCVKKALSSSYFKSKLCLYFSQFSLSLTHTQEKPKAIQMAIRIVYGVVFLSFSCACIKFLHLILHPVFFLTS